MDLQAHDGLINRNAINRWQWRRGRSRWSSWQNLLNAMGFQSAHGVSVSTNKPDYSPGELATITAKGVRRGEQITFAIADDPRKPGDDGEPDVYQHFAVRDGSAADLDGVANGEVITTWRVPSDNNGSGRGIPDALNATLRLQAKGVNGDVARTSFTDSTNSADTPPSDLPPEDQPVAAPAPALITDQADYEPGENATITASGFAVGSAVTFSIADDPNQPGDDGEADSYAPFTVGDGGADDLDGLANGEVVTRWLVPDDANASLILTAKGAEGELASTVASIAAPVPIATTSTSAQSVATDKADYAPNETATITAKDFTPGSTVEFAVEIVSDPGGDGVYGTSDDVVDAEATQLLAETPWVVADGSAADLDAAEGSVRTTWMVDPDALNTTLRLTATGFGADGVKSTLDDEVAIASFTDAQGSFSKPYAQWSDEPLPGDWNNNVLNDNKSNYFEGEVIPHVYMYGASNNAQLVNGQTYSFNLTYNWYQENTDAGGFAYMTQYNLSRQPNVFDWATPAIAPTADVYFTNNGGMNKGIGGNNTGAAFYTVDADITNVSAVTYNGTGNKDGVVTITFKYTGATTSNGYAAIYYGLYVAKPGEVPTQGAGTTNGASAWSGGSLQTTVDIGGSGATSIQLSPSAVKAGEISGLKFNDYNGDGSQGADEPGLAGWTICLDRDSDPDNQNNWGSVQTANGTTDDLDGNGIVDPVGFYYFSVSPGTYYVHEVNQTGWTQTAPSSKYYGPLVVSQATPTYLNQNFANQPSPSIDVEKSVSVDGGITWVDADSPTGPIALPDDQPLFKFVVTNTGNLELTNVTLTDSDFTIDTINGDNTIEIGSLAPGAQYQSIYMEAIWQKGQHTNTASVSGLYALGKSVADTDDANYFGDPPDVEPQIAISKLTNGKDGGTYLAGSDVVWTYAVTNPGSVSLSNITVSDDDTGLKPIYTSGDDGDSLLETGETWLYEATGKAVTGGYSNLGTATGSYTDEAGNVGPASASDASNYVGVEPQIAISKLTNGKDGGTYLAGSDVVWTYAVTNPGSVSLSNITVSDDDTGLKPIYTSGDDGDSLLETGETWLYEATGKAVTGGYSNLGTATGSYTDEAGNVGPASASDASNYVGVEPQIAISKLTNGKDGGTYLAGSDVVWTYAVTNPGSVSLSNITVSDDDTGLKPIYTSGDDGDSLLETGETWLYEATGKAVTGGYSNLGTATGSYTDEAGNVGPASASDASNYVGVEPQIAISKLTNGKDGGTYLAGSDVVWTYAVTNPGSVSLSNITVSDDDTGLKPIYTSGDDGDSLLETGETWLYEATGKAVTGGYSNLGTATGSYTDEAGNVGPASASDASNYVGVEPQIAISKLTNGKDGGTYLAGSDVVWTYAVTNPGSVSLSNITVSDDDTGLKPIYTSGDDGDSLLETGETWLYEATGKAVTGGYSNLGTATGSYTDEAGNVGPASASDASNYVGVEPQIAISKLTNGKDGGTYLAGSDVVWTYAVTNPGSVSLSNITVSDDDTGLKPIYTSGDDGDSLLETGETWLYEATGKAVTGGYSNLGTATGSYTDEAGNVGPASASDASNYVGVEPQIAISKLTNGKDGGTYLAGSDVVWTYAVTNPGSVSLSNITVSDDDTGLKPIYTSGDDGDSLLETGETWLYEATGKAVTGGYSNLGTATGSYTDEAGNVGPASASDASNYVGVEPQIAISKLTNGKDGGTYLAGSDVVWTYAVTNPGSVSLSNITVSDDDTGLKPIYTSGDDGDSLLETGETWLYEATGKAVTGGYSNLGTATGSYTDEAGNVGPASASDASNYVGVEPQIAISKLTNGKDGGTYLAGSDVVWTYAVTNPGSVSLSNITVSDDDTGLKPIYTSGDDGDSLLETGETWLYEATGKAVTGGYSNLGTATGSYTDEAGNVGPASASDASNYVGILPGLVTNSSLCTFDANSAEGGSQFNLILTPDLSQSIAAYRLSDSNPGQFYYNVCYAGRPGDQVEFEFEIPGPFVLQGAVPVHVYSDVGVDQSDGVVCFEPGIEIASFKAADLRLDDLDGDGTKGYVFQAQVPSTGFVYANMHLDYGLEKQTGWVRGDGDKATSESAEILDNTSYVFSSNIKDSAGDISGSADEIVNDNIFKKIKGVGGAIKYADTSEPVPDGSIILKGANGKVVGTAKSDADGWWFTNVDAPGKPSTYNVYWDKNNDGNVTNDPSKTITWGGSVKYVSVDFAQSGLFLDANDPAYREDGVAAKLATRQLAPVVEAAKAYWSAQGADVRKLRHVDLLIGDLGGVQLGSADDDSLITLDDDAAGQGWSVSLGRVMPGKVDLFSAISHEFGHILGYDHELMGSTLGIGERRLPFERDESTSNPFLMTPACSPLL